MRIEIGKTYPRKTVFSMVNTQDFDICIPGDVIVVIRWRQICISLGTTILKSNQCMTKELVW